MDGVARRSLGDKVPKLPGMVTHRQLSGDTQLPRLLLNRRLLERKPVYRCNLVGHYGCVNAIEFSNRGEYLASGGDDRRVLIWNIQEAISPECKVQPQCMKGEHHSNIFCMAFDHENGKIFSGGNDDQVLVHDTRRGDTVDVFLHEDAVYGLAVDPRNENIYASACADGRVLLWDIRAPSTHEPFVLANYVTGFHAVVYHPQEPRFLATANAKEGVGLWDVRAPRSCLLRYGSAYSQMNAMSVRFNKLGSQIVALRRRLPAALYNIHSSVPAVEFSHEGYYNSCTMKSCCFGGDKDEFVLSGSDDFNLYVWKVPEPSEEILQVNEAHLVLTGHRQIVNQVRCSPDSYLVASSGVEKVIKIWSPIQYPGMTDAGEVPRKMFSRQQYFNLMISTGSALSHDYSEKSTEEDPRMLAFFDSFIQREVDHSFSSDSSDDSALSPDSLYLHFVRDHVDGANSSDADGIAIPSLLPPELGIVSDSDSDRLINPGLGPSNENQSVSRSRVDERSVSATSSDAATGSAQGSSAQKSDNQERNKTSASEAQDRGTTSQGSNDAESSRTHRRVRISSRSTSDSSSSSDESEDFLVMRYRSRLLRRIMRQKSKKVKEAAVTGKALGDTSSQVEKDRLASLQQRLAFSRVMKERITEASESDSSSEDNEQFLEIVGRLQQRTDSARQRGLSLRHHRMRAMEESSSLTGSRTRSTTSLSVASQSPQRNAATNLSSVVNRTAPVMSNHSPANSPQRLQNGHSDNASESTNSSMPKHAQASAPSPSKKRSKSPIPKHLKNFASTSNGSRSQPKKSVAGSNSEPGNSEAAGNSAANAKDGETSTNGFKKFKVHGSSKKRLYRSTNCYSRQKDSDSD